MTDQERAGMAAAINDAIRQGCAEVRAELESVRRSGDERIEALTQENAQIRRDLEAARTLAAEPVLREALIDAAGVLRLVQRNGATLSAPIVDLTGVIAAAVARGVAEAADGMRAELRAEIARGMQRAGNAPRWSKTALYSPGAIVSWHIGRVYELRAGVAGSMSQDPSEHPDVWERVGSAGFRVMKSKPDAHEPGDLFTDADSKFISDGENVTLLVARPVKQSEIERQHKALQAGQAANEREVAALRAQVRPLVERTEALEVIVHEAIA